MCIEFEDSYENLRTKKLHNNKLVSATSFNSPVAVVMTSSSDNTTAISTLTTHNSSTSSSYDKMKCKLLKTEEELKNLKKQKLSSDDNIINKGLGLNTIPNCPGFSRQMYMRIAELYYR